MLAVHNAIPIQIPCWTILSKSFHCTPLPLPVSNADGLLCPYFMNKCTFSLVTPSFRHDDFQHPSRWIFSSYEAVDSEDQ